MVSEAKVHVDEDRRSKACASMHVRHMARRCDWKTGRSTWSKDGCGCARLWWLLVILSLGQGYVRGTWEFVTSNAKRNASEYSEDLAITLAEFQSAAYCYDLEALRSWTCVRCRGRTTGFQLYDVVYDVKRDLVAYIGYFPGLDAILTVFRGSNSRSLRNWLQDLNSVQARKVLPYKGAADATVHKGFYEAYHGSLLQERLKYMARDIHHRNQDMRFFILGHSLGAAMAQLYALDIYVHYNITNLEVHTFGSPRVGNYAYAEFFNRTIPYSVRMTHQSDIVPSLPPASFGFHHVPREVWSFNVELGALVPDFIFQKVCDGSGEDPTCSLSVCHLGFCTSIADHLQYYGLNMMHTSDC